MHFILSLQLRVDAWMMCKIQDKCEILCIDLMICDEWCF